MATVRQLFERRKRRNRCRFRKHAGDRARLSVFRSGKHIYAQVIDDKNGVTLAAACSLEGALREDRKNGATVEAAGVVGKAVAERATEAGVKDVTFDRGGYAFHGRVKALAEAAREAGLSF